MEHLDRPSAPIRNVGTCFGFSVHSTIPLACLRDGDGPRLNVGRAAHDGAAAPSSPVTEWRTEPAAEPFARLYQEGDDYWLWMTHGGWTRIEPRVPRITIPESLHRAAVEEHLWTIPISLCLLHRGDLALHAAAIEVNGRGILLVAPGGSGKSTLAAAFVQAGHRLLAEDIACVRVNGSPCVIPGPAMLRLRPDVLARVAPPGSRIIRQIPSRVTFALDEHSRGGCAPVPLRAVFLLDGPSDGHMDEPLSREDAIRRLWPMAFKLPGDKDTAACFGRLAGLVTALPVRSFARPRRLEELPRAVADLSA